MTTEPIISALPAAELLPPEHSGRITRAEESRAAGILAGRLLFQAGAFAPFKRDHNGVPCWPEGFSGSITHCLGEVAVAVRQGKALGIDMEKISRVTEKIFFRISTPQEKDFLTELQDEQQKEIFRALVFSAKEAAWKLVRSVSGDNPYWQDLQVKWLMPQHKVEVSYGKFPAEGFFFFHKNMIIVILEEKNEGAVSYPPWLTQRCMHRKTCGTE